MGSYDPEVLKPWKRYTRHLSKIEDEREDLFRLIVKGLLILIGISLIGVYVPSCEPRPAHAVETRQGLASWYSAESCERESGQHRMANGELLDDEAKTCASWDYPFGTILRVWHGSRSVLVECTDRGPAKRLVKKGIVIDLSKRAFRELAPLGKGLIDVEIEKL